MSIAHGMDEEISWQIGPAWGLNRAGAWTTFICIGKLRVCSVAADVAVLMPAASSCLYKAAHHFSP